MENVMSNGFAELSANDMLELDGGKYHWYDIPLSIAYPVYGVGKAAYELFMLGYRNGYDSTR